MVANAFVLIRCFGVNDITAVIEPLTSQSLTYVCDLTLCTGEDVGVKSPCSVKDVAPPPE